MSGIKGRLQSAGLLLALAIAGSATAQTFPSRPITLIYPFGTGSASEVVMRAMTPGAGKALGQPVIIDIKAGANGRLGLLAQKNAPGDGHILSFVSLGTIVTVPLTDPNFRIEPGKDYTPMIAVQFGPYVVAAHPSMPFKDMRGLIAYAKANPGKLNSGNTGIGGIQHIATGLLADTAGIDITSIAYKGEPPVIQAILANEVQMGFVSIFAKPQIDAGKLVPLVTTNAQRLAQFPNVPTAAEAGFPSLSGVGFWTGLIAPPETSRDVITKLNGAFAPTLQDPAVVKVINDFGSVALGGSADDFSKLIRTEFERLRPVVQKLKLQ